ncbi:MAG: hypothetical protein RRY47_01295, partial [Oscillospiraceae bacterium]
FVEFLRFGGSNWMMRQRFLFVEYLLYFSGIYGKIMLYKCEYVGLRRAFWRRIITRGDHISPWTLSLL